MNMTIEKPSAVILYKCSRCDRTILTKKRDVYTLWEAHKGHGKIDWDTVEDHPSIIFSYFTQPRRHEWMSRQYNIHTSKLVRIQP